jgi:hypothetical protein
MTQLSAMNVMRHKTRHGRTDGRIAKELQFTHVSRTISIWPRNLSYFYNRSKTVFARSDHARGAASCSSRISLKGTTSLAHDVELSLNSTEDEVPERTRYQRLFLRPEDLTDNCNQSR